MHPSTLDYGTASGAALVSVVLFVLAYRLGSGRMKFWHGTFLYASCIKRNMLAKFFTLLGAMMLFRTIGELFHVSILNGLAELGVATIILVTLPRLHSQPLPIGVVARTERGREKEQSIAALLMFLLVIGAVLNFFFGICT
jgi:hypothetical protein